MIHANELRVGNWVNWYEPCKITAIDTDGGNYISIVTHKGEHRREIDIERFKPISLTPEILEKCAFEFRANQQPKTADGKVYGITNTTILYGRTTDGSFAYFLDGYHNDVEIKYLHQLQNIYFALTGKELEITLQ